MELAVVTSKALLPKQEESNSEVIQLRAQIEALAKSLSAMQESTKTTTPSTKTGAKREVKEETTQ